MIENPMDVLEQFPVRKSNRQKQSFRDAVQSYAEGLGYPARFEKGSFGAQNVVIGDPASAKYLITAHYDTPACMVVPNLITPCNFATYLLYQIFVVVLFLAVALGIGVLAGLLVDDAQFAVQVGMIVYWGMLIMMLFGPANKHNANDNTSGVVTVLKTAKRLPVEYRDKVCFVLFDLEEAGLLGSASYAKQHKMEIKNQIILNCDCVGDGNELMLFPTKKLKKDADKMELLSVMEQRDTEKSVTLHQTVFPSILLIRRISLMASALQHSVAKS